MPRQTDAREDLAFGRTNRGVAAVSDKSVLPSIKRLTKCVKYNIIVRLTGQRMYGASFGDVAIAAYDRKEVQ